jgi:hypothetical protein
MAMGPEHGTQAYRDQVETISTALKYVPHEMLGDALMLYVLDTSFSRAAICEAEKVLRKAPPPSES